MQIFITNPTFQTILFALIFIPTLLISIRKVQTDRVFSLSKTLELKGLAMLTIIFSHIGYFLSTDTAFLYPFSILAGVGVNLFLFLSGFGLTLSTLKSNSSILDFYKERLKRLFAPLWIVISIILILDFLLFQKSYPASEILQSFMGFFPNADIFTNLNSPLWYFSLILFYYLIFPLTFFRKLSYLSPLLILVITYFVLNLPTSINPDVLKLYKLHSLSFPLGVLTAILITDKNLRTIKLEIKNTIFSSFFKYLLIAIFMCVAMYTSVNSGVGQTSLREQTISLITMFSIIFVFLFKGFEFEALKIYGQYSYEIYLIHWPILIRFGQLYLVLPAFLATYLYLGIFLFLGRLLQQSTKKVLR